MSFLAALQSDIPSTIKWIRAQHTMKLIDLRFTGRSGSANLFMQIHKSATGYVAAAVIKQRRIDYFLCAVCGWERIGFMQWGFHFGFKISWCNVLLLNNKWFHHRVSFEKIFVFWCNMLTLQAKQHGVFNFLPQKMFTSLNVLKFQINSSHKLFTNYFNFHEMERDIPEKIVKLRKN